MTIARVKDNGTVHYPPQDHLGTAIAVTNGGSGAVLWRDHYLPFGKDVQRTQNEIDLDEEGFTGHVKDKQTGMIYMQARYYFTEGMRFTSADPVQFSVDEPQMFNRYSYVHNDPINQIDPDGRQAVPSRFSPLRSIARNIGNPNSTQSKIMSVTPVVGDMASHRGRDFEPLRWQYCCSCNRYCSRRWRCRWQGCQNL